MLRTATIFAVFSGVTPVQDVVVVPLGKGHILSAGNFQLSTSIGCYDLNIGYDFHMILLSRRYTRGFPLPLQTKELEEPCDRKNN